MPWCKRCEKRFSRLERENYKKPKMCANCARESNANRTEKIRKTYGV